MTYQFEEDEFTSWEILEYLKLAYGKQLNGSPFINSNIVNWIKQRKVADIYGGYKITSVNRYKELGNLQVITLDGISRTEMKSRIGNLLDNMCESTNKKRTLEILPKIKRPRKQRTRLYYQLLPKSKQSTKKTLAESTLHGQWKNAGGKNNQLVNRSKFRNIK